MLRERKITLENTFRNTRIVWTKLNELLNNKHKKSSEVFINGKCCIITGQEIISNRCNNYFVNVAQHLLKRHGETNNKFNVILKTQVKTVSSGQE